MPPPEPQTDVTHTAPCVMVDKCTGCEPFIDIEKKPVIWILGGPGCGKGTQCALLVEKYCFCHISSGDLLRAEVLKGGDRAVNIKNTMLRGDLVPYDIVLKLVREEMVRLEPEAVGFLIDGYPREQFQCLAFEQDVSPASLVIYFEASRETLLKRLENRAAKAASRRLDDNEEAFHRRIDMFFRYNQPILEMYADKLYTISVEADIQEIFVKVQSIIDPLMKKIEDTPNPCGFCKPLPEE